MLLLETPNPGEVQTILSQNQRWLSYIYIQILE